MYQQPPRRKARAIAISDSLEMRRKAVLAKFVMLLGLAFGAAEAISMMHAVFAAR